MLILISDPREKRIQMEVLIPCIRQVRYQGKDIRNLQNLNGSLQKAYAIQEKYLNLSTMAQLLLTVSKVISATVGSSVQCRSLLRGMNFSLEVAVEWS